MKKLMLEGKKQKGKYLFLITICMAGLLLAWNVYVMVDHIDTDSWVGQIYNMLVINGLTFPLLSAVLASRMVDEEHKGNTWKLLETMHSKLQIYAGKLNYGYFLLFLFITIETMGLILIGKYLGYPGRLDWWSYALLFAGNLSICIIEFTLQLILSMVFANQAIALCIGVAGSLASIFLLYLPAGIVHCILPWGLFSIVSFVRMQWDYDTRIMSYYYEFPSWHAWIIVILWMIVLVLVGYYLFCQLDTDGTFQFRKKLGSAHKTSAHPEASHRFLPASLLKCRRTPILFAAFVLPLISGSIGYFNYTANIEVLTEGWYSLWTQHSLFTCLLFFGPMTGVCAGFLWSQEHQGANWNLIVNRNLKCPKI